MSRNPTGHKPEKMDDSLPLLTTAALADEVAALHLKLERRDAQLAAARTENVRLRHTQAMLEAELRQTEQQAETDLDVAHCSLRSARIGARAMVAELHGEENVRQELVADHRRHNANALAEADAQRAAVVAEIGHFEIAALAANAERDLLTDALGATERSLADVSARATRAMRAAEAAHAAGVQLPSRRDAAPAARMAPSRNDGLTPAEAATGPSGSHVDSQAATAVVADVQ